MQFWETENLLYHLVILINITVPADHVMEATDLMNRSEVFTPAQVKDGN
jgi:hypothetical protein